MNTPLGKYVMLHRLEETVVLLIPNHEATTTLINYRKQAQVFDNEYLWQRINFNSLKHPTMEISTLSLWVIVTMETIDSEREAYHTNQVTVGLYTRGLKPTHQPTNDEIINCLHNESIKRNRLLDI